MEMGRKKNRLTHAPTDDESLMQLQPTDPINSEHSMNHVSAAMEVNDGVNVVIDCDFPLRKDYTFFKQKKKKQNQNYSQIGTQHEMNIFCFGE